MRCLRAVLVLALATVVAGPALAGCPDGQYEIDTSPLSSKRPVGVELLSIESGLISLSSGCPPVPVTLKGTRRRGTKVSAVLNFCDGLACPLKLKAVIAPDCETISGTFTARRCRVRQMPFEGARVSCGDGVLDPDELCDGSDLGPETCQTLGFAGGVLLCAPDCSFDLTLCDGAVTRCGNSVREPGEQCDVNDFGTDSCETLGFASGGTLACKNDCTIVTRGCFSCGNGVREGNEQCDDKDDSLCPAPGMCGSRGSGKREDCMCPERCCQLLNGVSLCDEALVDLGGVDYCTLLGGVMKAFGGVPATPTTPR